MGEVTVQYWCFRGILAPVTQYRDSYYPGTRFTGSSMAAFPINLLPEMLPQDLQDLRDNILC